MSELCNETIILKSRKEHKCGVCSNIIPKGDSYKKVNVLYDGEFSETKICNDCNPLADKYCEIHKEYIEMDGFSYEDIPEDVREVVRRDCPDVNECKNRCVQCNYGKKKYLEYEVKKFWK